MPLAKHQLLEPGFRIIAYRGGAGEFPENTLEAVARAAQLPGVVVEIDVRRTVDGELVAMHDAFVQRTTNAEGAVAELSYAVLAKLNAGYNFEQHGRYPYRESALAVPRIAEVLASFPELQLVLDVHSDHPDVAGDVLKLVRQQHAAPRVVIASENARVVQAIRREEPNWLFGATSRELLTRVLLQRVWLDSLAPRTGGILMIPESHKGLQVLSPRFLRRASSRGERVWVWVVDTIDDMDRLRNLGVDGVFTPNPAAFVQAQRVAAP